MARVVLKTVSSQFEGEMIKDLLKEIDVEVFLSEQNGPEHMEVYLGQENAGVDLYVEDSQLPLAVEFLETQPELLDEVGEVPKNKIGFPYGIVIGFLGVLVIYMYFYYWR